MVRKTTSLKIEEDLWKKFKIYCITENIDMSDKLESIIKKEIKK